MNKFNSIINDKIVYDSFNAFLVKDANFTIDEEYPILESSMIAKTIPKNILPFSKAICFKGDLSDTFICFYAPDMTFERIRRYPKRYLNFFKRTAGIIGFDFSIHTDMPLIKQKQQINDNLSLMYYYGKNGIPIIPNIRCGSNILIDEYLSAIPKKAPVAIGTHGFIKHKSEKYEWYCFIEKIINTLHPSQIIVYGSLNSKLFDDFKLKHNFIFYEPWISHHWKEVNKHAN